MKPLYGRHIINRLATMVPPAPSECAAVAVTERAGAQAIGTGT